MSTRRAALNRQIKKNEFSSYHDFNEHCDFCVLSFQTRPELKTHVLTHFKKKTCPKTQKTLLLIADDWFELHINHGCTSERCDFETISNSVHFSEQMVKKEGSHEDLDTGGVLSTDNGGVLSTDNDGLLNIDTDSALMKYESEREFNFNMTSSESSSASSENKVTKFESKAKRTKSKKAKVESISSTRTKREKVPSITNTAKPVLPKSKRTKCKICKFNLAREALMFHLQSRHVPKIESVPTCETCGKTFSTPGNLRSHQYLHAERGRYICNYCGKEFVRNSNLKEHINLHTGARPYVCEVCKKTFHRETLLRNHRRIHTGEKKYRCNIENCERAYMFDIDLKRHKFSAHGIYSKKHSCFICSKVFSENKLLKKHLEAH